MPAEDLKFGPEAALLEAICIEAFEGGRQQQLRELVARPGFDWERLIGMSLRHKLAPMVSFILDKHGLIDRTYITSGDLYVFLYNVLHLNRHRHTVLGQELAAVAEGFGARGIPFVARKGVLLDWQFFQGEGLRVINDLDIMIMPDSAEAATKVMHGLGYRHGKYDAPRGVVGPLSRQELITYRLNPDHLPRFVKPSADPVVRLVEMDIAMSFTWTSSEYNVSLSEAFATSLRYDLPQLGAALPSFSPGYQFLDTTLHFFREAYTENAIRDENDFDLKKFLDVLLLWKVHRAALESEGFRSLVRDSHVAFPVAWVLGCIDNLFQTNLLGSLGLEEAVTKEQLSTWRASGGQIKSWSGDMRGRLYAKNRRGMVLGEASA